MSAVTNKTIICPGCDVINRIPAWNGKGRILCARCGQTLFRDKPETVDRTLCFAIAGLCFALLSNVYPILTFTFQGSSASNFLTTGPFQLMNGIFWPLALLVLWTSLYAPALKMLGLTYVLLPLKFGWRFPGLTTVFKYTQIAGKWCLIEVYAAGILVAMTKLDEMGTTEMDLGAYILFALFICSVHASRHLNREMVWEKIFALRRLQV